MGLDFLVHYNIDLLVSRNALLIDGQHLIPAVYKRRIGDETTYEIGQVQVRKRVVIPPHTIR